MNKKLFSAVIVSALSLSVLTGGAYAAEKKNNYIIRTENADVDSVAAAVSKVCPDAEINYIYDKLIRGFSAALTERDAARLASLYGVESVRRSAVYMMDGEEEESADDTGAGEDAGENEENCETEEAESAALSFSYTGAGQIVAVIDCGYNTKDPHFRLSEDGENAAALSRDDVRSAELNAGKANYLNSKIPFAYDYFDDDTNVMSEASHAMNIATLIGANGEGSDDGYSGVAPDCQLLLMKVFDDDGEYATEDAILAALEDAYALGADVVNLSFGSPCGTDAGDPIDVSIIDALRALCDENVAVVCAAGNNGRTGDYMIYDDYFGVNDPAVFMMDNGTIASPASVPGTIAVGSYAAFGYYVPVIILGDGSEIAYEDTSEEFFRESFISRFDGEALEYVVVDGIGTEEDIAGAGDMTGKLAVIYRGEITFVEKCENAAAAGAVGVIIINTDPSETVSMDLTDAPIPAISVSGESGELLVNSEKKAVYIALGQFSSAGEKTRVSYNPSSSWGPTPELGLKPDLIAPGYHIGAIGLDGKLEYSDGTSIAAGYVSGVVALLGQKLREEGNDSAELKKTLLMNGAVPMTGDRESSYSPASYSPRAQGAGMIDADIVEAVLCADTVITSPSVSLGDGLGRMFSMNVTVTNDKDTDSRYAVSAEVLTDNIYDAEVDSDELGFEAPMFIAETALGIPASVRMGDSSGEINIQSEQYSGNTVFVKAGSSAELIVRVMIPDDLYADMMSEAPYGRYIDGYVYFDDLGESGGAPLKSYSVPFMGYLGDWSALPAADPSAYGNGANAYYGSYMYSDIYFDGVEDTAVLGSSAVFPEDYISDLCVFSPNGDENCDYVMMQLNMLRDVADCRYTIYNDKGKAVYSVSNDAVMTKSYLNEDGNLFTYDFYLWDGTAEDNGYYIYPDGDYTVEFEFILFDGSVQSETYKLHIDTKAPEVVGAEISEENGTKLLKVTVRDDFALDFIDVYYLADTDTAGETEVSDPEELPDDEEEPEDEAGEEPEDYLEEIYEEFFEEDDEVSGPVVVLYDTELLHGEDACEFTENEDGSLTVEFDITGLETEKLYIYVYDYALNRRVEMIRPN